MKLKRLIASAVAAALSVSAVAVSASAYEFGTKNRLAWDPEVLVPAEEFAELAEKPVITLTLETREMPDGYYCVKPCWDAENGWDFIMDETPNAPAMPDAKDSYTIEKDQTTLTFTVPERMIPTIQENGIHFLGYAVNLLTMTLSAEAANDAPANEPAVDDNNTAEPAGDTTTPVADKNSPDTGVEGVAVVAGIAVIAAGAMVISKKRK